MRESNYQKLSDLLNTFKLENRKLNNINQLEEVLVSEYDKEMVKKE